MPELDTQWTCKTKPFCLCIDHECEFTCECRKSPTMARCRDCAQKLVEIDVDSGE